MLVSVSISGCQVMAVGEALAPNSHPYTLSSETMQLWATAPGELPTFDPLPRCKAFYTTGRRSSKVYTKTDRQTYGGTDRQTDRR